jgi:Tol biopolymer transport system component
MWFTYIIARTATVVIAGLMLLVAPTVVIGTWLPGGIQVAFMHNQGNESAWNIFLLDVDRRIAAPLIATDAWERYPAWSPDGETLGFHANPHNHYALYTYHLPSQTMQQMTGGDSFAIYDEAMMAWSPDGSQIGFHSNSLSYDYHLYLMDDDGSNIQPVFDTRSTSIHMDWSPDGTQIAFVIERDGIYAIHSLDLEVDSQESQMLTSRGFFPAWSPDGTQIAFVSDRDGLETIYIMDADGSNQRHLTGSVLTSESHPIWLPDGRIMFASDRNGNMNLYTINPDGTDLRQITDLAGDEDAPAVRP